MNALPPYNNPQKKKKKRKVELISHTGILIRIDPVLKGDISDTSLTTKPCSLSHFLPLARVTGTENTNTIKSQSKVLSFHPRITSWHSVTTKFATYLGVLTALSWPKKTTWKLDCRAF